MILAKDKIDEFEVAAQPLMKWMEKNLHPHTTAIVDSHTVELFEAVCRRGQLLDNKEEDHGKK